MTIEERLDMVRDRLKTMNNVDALNWSGAFIGACCTAIDNEHKWNVCLSAADIAVKMAGKNVLGVQTKENKGALQ
jgi:hypothetical protein